MNTSACVQASSLANGFGELVEVLKALATPEGTRLPERLPIVTKAARVRS